MKSLLKRLNAIQTETGLVNVLSTEDKQTLQDLQETAWNEKRRTLGEGVWLRGLVEWSNRCVKDCYYCGIRRSERTLQRYELPRESVLQAASEIDKRGYGSMVIQGGERRDRGFIEEVETVLREIRGRFKDRLAVTLSLGEQTAETYERWFNAGATRYLLRIETSSQELYSRLHPSDHSFRARIECLKTLRKAGYQVGTGVMIGLPGQSLEDLARDLLFFRDLDIDMLGMGPFIPHAGTPLGAKKHLARIPSPERRLRLSLNMIALARLLMPEINIASTTALQTLDPRGRELGLLHGANVLMPNCTPVPYKTLYGLYDGKPCVQDSPATCHGCLEARVRSIGEKVLRNDPGTSLRFLRRTCCFRGR